MVHTSLRRIGVLATFVLLLLPLLLKLLACIPVCVACRLIMLAAVVCVTHIVPCYCALRHLYPDHNVKSSMAMFARGRNHRCRSSQWPRRALPALTTAAEDPIPSTRTASLGAALFEALSYVL